MDIRQWRKSDLRNSYWRSSGNPKKRHENNAFQKENIYSVTTASLVEKYLKLFFLPYQTSQLHARSIVILLFFVKETNEHYIRLSFLEEYDLMSPNKTIKRI